LYFRSCIISVKFTGLLFYCDLETFYFNKKSQVNQDQDQQGCLYRSSMRGDWWTRNISCLCAL